MEKVVHVLLGRPADGPRRLRERLLDECAPRLRAAGAERVQINVADPALGHPFGVSPDSAVPELTAMVSAWVDSAEQRPLAPALFEPGGEGRWWGYLVCEAEPLPNSTAPPASDGRVPGFAQVVLLSLPSGLSWTEWRSRWQGQHTAVALGTQSTFRYVQNVVVRPLSVDAPPYVAVVEECFPEEAAGDLHVFFDAVGDDQRLERHMAAMSESCDRFMDGSAPVAWTREWLPR
jgi:hypothetical protein